MWERVVGQERAVAQLQRAAKNPVHAYLFVGPKGSGVENAARCFAAEIVSSTEDQSAKRILRGVHPDVVEFVSEGLTYRIKEDVRERIIPEAWRAPVEGDRKVVVITDAERLREDSANALLKTIEEPPASTIVLLLTQSPDELLGTVQSRCQRVNFNALSPAHIADALESDGVEAKRATLIAELSGGHLARARLLAGPLGPVRDAFAAIPAQLDGTGATAVRLVDEALAVIGDATAHIEQQQAQEEEELETELEQAGYPERTAQAMRKRLAAQHERELRQVRTEALLEGITAIETAYRDALATDPRSSDQSVPKVSDRSASEALDACAQARAAFEFNPTDSLLLENLLLHLPS